ncbi:MAG: (2Fe-2S)-binding protein [Candidatus Neomarinimicrobiota bacterium]
MKRPVGSELMLFSDKPEYFDLSVTINGKLIRRTVLTHLRLLDFLRDDLRLTGAKEVCGEGECGACTVILDGKTVNSCLILAVETHGSTIQTIEGMTPASGFTELQKSFVDQHSVQCGYCIPGMVLSADQLQRDCNNPDHEAVKEGLTGNICRCTGYKKIIAAVEKGSDG